MPLKRKIGLPKPKVRPRARTAAAADGGGVAAADDSSKKSKLDTNVKFTPRRLPDRNDERRDAVVSLLTDWLTFIPVVILRLIASYDEETVIYFITIDGELVLWNIDCSEPTAPPIQLHGGTVPPDGFARFGYRVAITPPIGSDSVYAPGDGGGRFMFTQTENQPRAPLRMFRETARHAFTPFGVEPFFIDCTEVGVCVPRYQVTDMLPLAGNRVLLYTENHPTKNEKVCSFYVIDYSTKPELAIVDPICVMSDEKLSTQSTVINALRDLERVVAPLQNFHADENSGSTTAATTTTTAMRDDEKPPHPRVTRVESLIAQCRDFIQTRYPPGAKSPLQRPLKPVDVPEVRRFLPFPEPNSHLIMIACRVIENGAFADRSEFRVFDSRAMAFVPHVSTAPATRGQEVHIRVHGYVTAMAFFHKQLAAPLASDVKDELAPKLAAAAAAAHHTTPAPEPDHMFGLTFVAGGEFGVLFAPTHLPNPNRTGNGTGSVGSANADDVVNPLVWWQTVSLLLTESEDGAPPPIPYYAMHTIFPGCGRIVTATAKFKIADEYLRIHEHVFGAKQVTDQASTYRRRPDECGDARRPVIPVRSIAVIDANRVVVASAGKPGTGGRVRIWDFNPLTLAANPKPKRHVPFARVTELTHTDGTPAWKDTIADVFVL